MTNVSDSSDKYPEDSGRRRFVKGVVGGAALAGVGTVGAATINSATSAAGAGGGITNAFAIENIAGPAPRGMPLIPISITDDGFLKGVWPEPTEIDEGGVTVTVARTENFRGAGFTYSSTWFQYCGVQSYQGLDPSYESDNFFHATSSPPYAWEQEAFEADERLSVDAFDDYDTWGNGIGQPGLGKPATATWRSQDSEDTIPVLVFRSPRIEAMAQESEIVDALTQDGFMAWLNKCTHFCCVPGYKETESAAKFDAEDLVYCQCHQSVYDPFSIVEVLFTALPRPDE